MKVEFSRQISEKYSNFMKLRHVGVELFHADRKVDSQTDRHDKANSRYPKFYERV
jgi:hypothetical protein